MVRKCDDAPFSTKGLLFSKYCLRATKPVTDNRGIKATVKLTLKPRSLDKRQTPAATIATRSW